MSMHYAQGYTHAHLFYTAVTVYLFTDILCSLRTLMHVHQTDAFKTCTTKRKDQ